MNEMIPQTLVESILTEPLWLQIWVNVLVLTNLAALAFLAGRNEQGRYVRREPLAIIASFFAAAVLMEVIFRQLGYVRLLGLGHLVFWTPVWVWLFMSRRRIGFSTPFGVYIHCYLLVAGLSLVIDAVDAVRYLSGDGELLYRWRE